MFSSDRQHPDAAALERLAAELAARGPRTAVVGPWASGSFACLARSGALAGFIPADCGGTAGAEPALVALLATVAEHCLTTALVLSQWAAACRIIAAGPPAVRSARLPALGRGETPTTVGISQLSTSRRHLAAPALFAARTAAGWRLDGLCPWVTGAAACDTIVTGAATDGGGQAFFVVPTAAAGVEIGPPMAMLALSGSLTSSVRLAGVAPADVILPAEGGGVRTGGLATTALALGATRAALALVADEAAARPALAAPAAGLEDDARALAADLDSAARHGAEADQRDALRARANGLVVRAAQAALTASKGAGFVAGHPAERLVREALFFLVWSCPQAVSTAVMCELAGIEPAANDRPG
jgi:alkylation response protein AidB-like acyl-CoA dehydrogenase